MATATPPPSHAPSGELLAGRYQLERRVGQGGMAEVWVATDLELDRKVAVKWLRTNLAADPVVTERFRREAVAVARLSHPNIVAVHDVFVHDGRQAVVMQLVDGKSLRQLLDTQKRLGPELTIHIGAAIAGALDEAHRAGFVHRDVKPGNILVTSDGRVLLTDFGIAKGLMPGDDLTSDNVMMGTAKYLSPEQVRGRRLDGRADIYSLGLVLYECLAGRVPFLGETDADTALARLQRDPTDLGHLRPTLPIGLVNLIHRTLARNPAHRPQTGSELRGALLAVDTSPPAIDGTPYELPERLASPPRRALGAWPGNPGDPNAAAAPTAIPGEPHVTRSQPVLRHGARSGVPSGSGSGADATPVDDHTPSPDEPMRGRPARRDQQRFTPTMAVVGVLLAAAVLVAAVLYVGLRGGDRQAFTPPASSAAPSAADAPATATPTATAVPGAIVAPADLHLVAAVDFDPDGDAVENGNQAPLALADGSSSTAWATVCYSNEYLSGKSGVGLVLTPSAPAPGTLSIESLNAPYQIEVYTTTDPVPPAALAGWRQVGERQFADVPGVFEVAVDVSATYLLVWVKQLGPDEFCTDRNPYRGRIGEISYRP